MKKFFNKLLSGVYVGIWFMFIFLVWIWAVNAWSADDLTVTNDDTLSADLRNTMLNKFYWVKNSDNIKYADGEIISNDDKIIRWWANHIVFVKWSWNPQIAENMTINTCMTWIDYWAENVSFTLPFSANIIVEWKVCYDNDSTHPLYIRPVLNAGSIQGTADMLTPWGMAVGQKICASFVSKVDWLAAWAYTLWAQLRLSWKTGCSSVTFNNSGNADGIWIDKITAYDYQL